MTGSEIINCPYLYMEESRRPEGLENLESFNQKVSHFPIGGPLSLGTQQNVFGSATALIRRETFDKIGGYTEMRGVCYEDFEFMLKVVQAGGKIEICPEPLYLYEVDRPSMISQTSPLRNYRRIVNAREIHPNEKAIHDILNLNAGRSANEDLQNRRSWEAKMNANSDIQSGIRAAGVDFSNIFELLASYSERVNAGRMRRTWAKVPSLETTSKEQPPKLVQSSKVSAQAKQMRESNDEVVTTLLSLVLVNRSKDAIASLEQQLNALPQVTEATMEWFVTLATPLLTTCNESFDKLCAIFLAQNISSTFAGKVIAKAATGANRSSTKLPLTMIQIKKRYTEGEQKYRETYPEVDDAIKNRGLLPDSMEHYKRHGYEEDRIGFDDFKIAAQLISLAELKTTPWEIPLNFGYDNFQQLPDGPMNKWSDHAVKLVEKANVA